MHSIPIRGLQDVDHADDVNPENYDAIHFTVGHGVMWDFPNDENLQNIASK